MFYFDFFFFLNELIKEKRILQTSRRTFSPRWNGEVKENLRYRRGNETEFNYFNSFPGASVVLKASWRLIEFWHVFCLLILGMKTFQEFFAGWTQENKNVKFDDFF